MTPAQMRKLRHGGAQVLRLSAPEHQQLPVTPAVLVEGPWPQGHLLALRQVAVRA